MRRCRLRNRTTGETRTHPPVTEEFIPQGYTIPEPPSRRLEEMTSTSSSSDSDSDESSSGTVRDDSERSESLGVSDGRSTAGTSIVSDSASESDGDESSGSASSPEKLDSDDDMDHSGDGTPSGTASSDTYASSDSSSGDEDRSSSSRDVSRSSGSSSTNTSSSSSRKTTSSSVSVDDKVGTSRQATRALVIAKERALSGNVPSLIKEEARGTHAIVENGPDGTDEITRRDTGKTLAALSDETRDVDVVGSPRRRGSERPSSRRSSSIRTEKSLDRQKEWEIEHARVRARRCRKQLVEKIRREENERRAMAKENREKLEASGPPIPTVQEIMSTVGWDSEKTYSTGELHQFATATRDKMCDFGLDSNLDEHFSDFRTKPF